MKDNNYILQYYQAISDGSENVGKLIKLAYEYVLDGLQDHSFYYNHKKAIRPIRFMENFVHHSKGKTGLLKLELWQKAFLSCVFGLVNGEDLRQFKEIVLSTGRKSGKTLLISGIADYILYCDEDYGKEIYFTATKKEQAELCYSAFYQTILKEPELRRLIMKRRSDVYLPSTNSSAKMLTSNYTTADGLNSSLNVCDEFAAWKGTQGLNLYSTLTSGTLSRKEPLTIAISTANRVNDGVYDTLYTRSTRLLMGGSEETAFLPFIYQIEDLSKWNDISELYKANPNLGVSIPVKTILEEIQKAEGDPQAKNEFLVKVANVKQNASTAWISTADIKKTEGHHLKLEDFKDKYCVVGIDLSQTTDLTSACVVVEDKGKINIISHFWLPSARIEEAILRDQVPYDKYIAQGIMDTSGENYIDYEDVFNWVMDLRLKYDIYPLFVGYDRYSAQYLVKQLSQVYQCEDVYQGDNLYPIMLELEGLIKDGRINIGDNNLLKMHLLNSAIKISEERGRGRLVKLNPKLHIDGTAALLCAMTMRNKYYLEYEPQFKNED
ncbi:MAG: terminase large subunit [Clostridiales bacterium]|nr:terminase large subunit [Clostridiales bacterium]